MKLTGRVFFHHVLYCAVAGGLATVLTWRILLNLLINKIATARLIACLLSVPLTVLGIYCIYPHPIYDSDCTLAILVCIVFLQRLVHKGFPFLAAFLTGSALVVPVFIKQNVGLVFLATTGLAFATLMGLEAWRRRPISGYAWLMAGIVTGLGFAALFIQITAGLANYLHWTIQFAASVRMPTSETMFLIYNDRKLPLVIAVFIVGVLILKLNRRDKRSLGLIGGVLISMPFLWPLESLLRHGNPSEVLRLWPFVLIASCVAALWLLWTEPKPTFTLALPFILIVTIHAAFLSQQVKGSTYALWPLLLLLVATIIQASVMPSRRSSNIGTAMFSVVFMLSVLICGAYYVSRDARLYYVNLPQGVITRSTLPALEGLSIRGPWIPTFEELVQFTDKNIPREDALVTIPGEDLFYYTTGRHPKFPVLMFDITNPYSPHEVLKLSEEHGIHWLVIKKDLQRKAIPSPDPAQFVSLLGQDFTLVDRLTNYDIYRHK